MSSQTRPGHERGGDTRNRIQAVALELFAEHGYDQTSLREIAERLGVTKAALYYHFKSKDEILDSVFEDRLASLEKLVDWSQSQPRTAEVRRELLSRYATEIQSAQQPAFMRFFERNPTVIHRMKAGVRMREAILSLREVLTAPAAPITAQIKSSLAILALQTSWFVSRGGAGVGDEERHRAALQVALELLEEAERESSPDDPAVEAADPSINEAGLDR